jgi:hypothetical protein
MVENASNVTDDGTARLSDMETLLRRLAQSQTPTEASEIVRRLLPGVIGGGEATLFVIRGEQALGVQADSGELWPIAKESAALDQVCRSDDNRIVAVPVAGTGAIVLRSPNKISPAEVHVLELFGQHAAAALKPAGLAASA